MSFKDFIKDQNSEVNKRKEEDRRDAVSKFRDCIEELYSEIENNWMREYVENGEMEISENEISITEEKLGEYQVNEMHIQIANQEIVLRPRGTHMIGTDARVDLVYLGIPRVQIVRVGENVDNPMQMITIILNGEQVTKRRDTGVIVWKIVQDDSRRSLVKLTKQSLEDTIMKVMSNG